MNDDLQVSLFKDFPELYQDMESSRTVFIFECGDGWYRLIRELSEKLVDIIKSLKFDPDLPPKASQVKEKYGSLRFYMYWSTDEMETLINSYENLSEKICEICGSMGEINTKRNWLSCRCDNHRMV